MSVQIKKPILLILSGALICGSAAGQVGSPPPPGEAPSCYPLRMEDSSAIYFTPDRFGIRADGTMDVSDALQRAVNLVKSTDNFGILFIPDGKYLISKTIFIPTAVRLIGYGKKRPLIILADHSPKYQTADSTDKGRAHYMLWFTSDTARAGEPVHDAGASTFYSALSNVNLKIGDGNPDAVALRTHFAQHSFIAHSDIMIGSGKAGIFDVGNEMEGVRFFGGDYGIYTTKTSPGWPFMMLDTYFEGQRKAAIRTQEAGLTIVRMWVRNDPEVIRIDAGFWEKLFMQDCRFENISGPALTISNEGNANTQISIRNVYCRNTPELASYRISGRILRGPGPMYRVKELIDGTQMDSLEADPEYRTRFDVQPIKSFPPPFNSDIPQLPPMETWVNLKSLGARGDGHTDDTRAIQAAVEKYPAIYVPQGWYRISKPIRLKPNTALIGLSPIATQFRLAENAEAFGGFGGPRPMLVAPRGGKNILSGIGLSTGASNPRAVACKWMAGRGSYLNDVKFIGGHGNMYKPQRGHKKGNRSIYGNEERRLWDTQYWSLWITDGGGGVFKNIWTANTFATSGVYISNTSTVGHIYGLSVEHHVRNEIRFNHVSNWTVDALQLEEESRESSECQPMELEQCSHMEFANLYMFRVIRINRPYPYSIRNWGSTDIEFLNVHNYSQIKYTTDNPFYDINSGKEVRPWEFTRLYIGPNPTQTPIPDSSPGKVQLLATGFEFAEGICKDSKGNIYFCDSRKKRIYKWSPEKRSMSLLADYPWEPLSLACDKQDHLLVVFKYTPKPGYLRHGKAEIFTNPPDAAGTSFSGWGNSGFATWVYSIDPHNPDETIRLLDTVPMGSINPIYKVLYPANRWRDFHDFNAITVARPKECFVAPDGRTIIPVVYDLARAAALAGGVPGKPLYISDEYNKRTVALSVDSRGYVTHLKYFAENGEFSSVPDRQGRVYIADGEVWIYSPAGKLIGLIHTPERPSTLVIAGTTGQVLFITGRKSLFATSIPAKE
ncbi:MAG TPA: glycosyl hydrolase family 28-related protein [Chitinophagaceae bacterium]|nr:glycosyl hydrolase family 28-related protein [Chitinophagaceae bacterium]